MYHKLNICCAQGSISAGVSKNSNLKYINLYVHWVVFFFAIFKYSPSLYFLKNLPRKSYDSYNKNTA